MIERSPLRPLAPVAVVAFGLAFLLVIGTSGGGSPDKPTRGTAAPRSERTRPARRLPRVYVVKSGDVLSSISERTHVSIDRLEELNPSLDPQLLAPGQRVKLRE